MAQTTTTLPRVKVADRRSPYIVEDWAARTFRVNREVFRSEEIFARERRQIWDRQWLYLGHESEIPKPGDFKQRTLAGRPLIFARDSRTRCARISIRARTAARSCAARPRGTRRRSSASTTRGRSRNTGELVGIPDSGRVSARARLRRRDGTALGPAVRELQRLRVRLLRRERPEPQRAPRRRARLPRHDGRPLRAGPAGHPRHAHVLDPRELEARGRERDGRLPLLADARDTSSGTSRAPATCTERRRWPRTSRSRTGTACSSSRDTAGASACSGSRASATTRSRASRTTCAGWPARVGEERAQRIAGTSRILYLFPNLSCSTSKGWRSGSSSRCGRTSPTCAPGSSRRRPSRRRSASCA